jgi:hypothetical protein
MRIVIGSVFALLCVLWSCKESPDQPKVIYAEETVETEEKPVDTTQIRIADLPVFIEGTTHLLHPIGDVRVIEGRSKSPYGSASTSRVSYTVSNYNRFELVGFLQNIHFQHLDSTSVKPLTNRKVIIQTATFLNTLFEKNKTSLFVYTVWDKDTNRDGKIDSNDIKSLFISKGNGDEFTKISPDFQELVDWNIIDKLNRIYFRTIEDTNKNGDFDKDDRIHYYFVTLQHPWEVVEYNPL